MSLESLITDYINPNFNTIPIQATIADAGKKMMELGVDGIFVLENGEIVGIVTQKDIMKVFSEQAEITNPVESVLSRPLIAIEHTAKVRDALQIMKEKNIRRLLVKEGSKPIGTITQKKIFGNLSSKAFELPELELPEKIKCPYCPSSFQKKDELSKHIDQIHIGYGVFQGNFSKAEDLGSINPPQDFPKTI